MSLTSSTHGAREHARAQAGARAETQPTVPARDAIDLPPGVAADDVIWDELIGAGGYAAHRLPRGARLRLDDRAGDACAALVVHRADAPAERLNVADTVKVQWNAYLGRGSLLLSDMGRVLATLEDDTGGRHDALCGASTARSNAARYDDGGVSGPHPSQRDRLLLALAKHGLGRRDLPPSLTLFKGVMVRADGSLAFEGDPRPSHVTLRAEMDLLVSVANAPHRLDPRAEYTCTPLRLTAWRGARTAEDDPLRTSSPERLRAFQNTEELLASAEGAA
ncbi:MAG: urea amidolyase associated protein UAAP1 [Thermoleophilia bacterium]